MAEPARRHMTADEFFRWDSGDDRTYQLIDGTPVAMAPPAPGHNVLTAEFAFHIRRALENRPECTVQTPGAGRSPTRDDRVWVPDLAVTYRAHRRNQTETIQPILVIEVLSPGTERGDWADKLPDYRLVPSVVEIVLIRQDRMFAEVHRRTAGSDWWPTALVLGPERSLRLDTVGLELPLSELYKRLDIA